jgi:hypothetical protein
LLVISSAAQLRQLGDRNPLLYTGRVRQPLYPNEELNGLGVDYMSHEAEIFEREIAEIQDLPADKRDEIARLENSQLADSRIVRRETPPADTAEQTEK